MSLIRKISSILNKQERRSAVVVFALTLVMSFFEVVGIASILPFIAVLSSPDMVHDNKYLHWGYEVLGFTSVNKYLFFLGFLSLFFLVVGNAAKAWQRWATLDFGIMGGHAIASRLFRQYLHQPYGYYLTRNSAELRKSIMGEVQTLVNQVIIPLMDVVARILVCIAILGLLVVVDSTLALSTGAILGGGYLCVYWGMRHWLLRIGEERLNAQTQRHKVVNEALVGIKTVKLSGLEDTYSELHDAPSRVYSRTSATSGMASELPKFALEVIAFGGILFIVLYQLLKSEGIAQALPMVTLYAFAGYRLMPNLQAAFSSYAKIRFNKPVLDRIQNELAETAIAPAQLEKLAEPVVPLPFDRTIEFRNVTFSFDEQIKPVFTGFNYTIEAGSDVGVVGRTGAGKTTFVDLLLGLLSPTSGEILIDGVKLTEDNIRQWQKNAAYVTQHVFLADDTVRANIAFGVPKDEINDERVIEAARMAAISDFIENDLPASYDSMVGENGIRLSGGQRQRLALARAFYLDRPLLILDEATSALDHETETEIMAAIHSLPSQKTVIMITHRTHSLERIEKVLKLGFNDDG